MPRAELDGASIFYRETGTGLPFVFCHEFAGSMESWSAQVSFFSRRYKIVTFNARGYPPSSVPDDVAEYSQDHQVETLLQLLDHLEISKAYICGLSMGAHTALNFSLAYPERCLGIVAAGAGTGSADPVSFAIESNQRADVLEAKGMLGMESYLTGSTRIRFKQKDRQGWEEFKRLFERHSPQGSARTLRGFQAKRPSLPSLYDKFAQSKIPTLILCGDEDDPCLQPSLLLKQAIPRSGLAFLPQTGHACNIEEPGLFNSLVAEFLVMVESGQWTHRPESSGDSWAMPSKQDL